MPGFSVGGAFAPQPERMTPGFLPRALRVALRAIKIAPGDFVDLLIFGSGGQRSIPLSYGRRECELYCLGAVGSRPLSD